MANVLVVYGTLEGQTEKIAKFIEKELERRGHQVFTIGLTSFQKGKVDSYDGILVGASVHSSKYPTSLQKWVKTNVLSLSSKPSAFFSVCLGILEKSNLDTQQKEKRVVEDFFKWSGWQPQLWSIFPGALAYSKYGWLKRRIMRAIAKKAGGDTDMSHDYEYTNWEDIRRFVQDFDLVLKRSLPISKKLA